MSRCCSHVLNLKRRCTFFFFFYLDGERNRKINLKGIIQTAACHRKCSRKNKQFKIVYNHNLKSRTPTKELQQKQLKHTAVIRCQTPTHPQSTCNMYFSIPRHFALEFHSKQFSLKSNPTSALQGLTAKVEFLNLSVKFKSTRELLGQETPHLFFLTTQGFTLFPCKRCPLKPHPCGMFAMNQQSQKLYSFPSRPAAV